MISRTNVCCNV